MSLVVCAVRQEFCVIASDGLAVTVREDGTAVPIADDWCKFWVVDDGGIAMACTGSYLMHEKIFQFSNQIAELHQDNPELFSILEREVPVELRRLKEQYPDIDIEYIDETESDPSKRLINAGGTNFLLAGYDTQQKRIRVVCYNRDLIPQEAPGNVWALGRNKAIDFVFKNIGNTISETSAGSLSFGPLSVTRALKQLINQAADQNPGKVGGEVFSHVVCLPEMKQTFEMEMLVA